jgi:hypothetical protein
MYDRLHAQTAVCTIHCNRLWYDAVQTGIHNRRHTFTTSMPTLQSTVHHIAPVRLAVSHVTSRWQQGRLLALLYQDECLVGLALSFLRQMLPFTE